MMRDYERVLHAETLTTERERRYAAQFFRVPRSFGEKARYWFRRRRAAELRDNR